MTSSIGAAYQLLIDFGRDLTYAHELADVTDRVDAAQLNAGMQNAYDEFAPPSRMAVELKNLDGMLSPDNVSSPYYGLWKRGTIVKLQAIYNNTIYPLWIGKLATLTPQIGSYSERVVRLECDDFTTELLDAEVKPPLTQDTTADQAIVYLFDTGIMPFPYAHLYWMIGVAGAGELDSIYLWENTITDFDTGVQTLAFTGDIEGDNGLNAQQFIRDMVAAEAGGRFFYQPRELKYKFHSRHRDATNLTNKLSMTADDCNQEAPPEYVWADDLANVVTINYIVREIGAAGTVIYTMTSASRTLRTGEVLEFNVRYVDVTEKHSRIGAKDVIPPLPVTDYTASYVNDGTDATGVAAVYVTPGGTSASVRITNTGVRDISLDTFQLRGTPIITSEQQFVTEQDENSIRDHGRKELTVNIPVIDDEEFARDYARIMVRKFKDARTRIPRVTFSANRRQELMEAVLTLSVGDRINFADAWSGHGRDYFIVGEQHILSIAGAPGVHHHQTTWTLRPAARDQFWLLNQIGYSELDFNTYLGF